MRKMNDFMTLLELYTENKTAIVMDNFNVNVAARKERNSTGGIVKRNNGGEIAVKFAEIQTVNYG